MTRILMRMAVFGALAVAGLALGGTSAMAQNCIGLGGGTDCPLQPGVPLYAQPYANAVPDAGRPAVVDPGWNGPAYSGRHYNQRGRNGWNRRHGDRVYIDRYVPVYPPSYYYDEYYEQPRRYSRPRYRVLDLTNAHVEWCYDRYKTYRESDNTYKKTRTKRVQCISPYI